MVLPVHESGGREWRQWKWLAKCLLSASIVFAAVWGLVSRDAVGSLMAALIPWGLAFGCLVIVMLWSIVLVPLLVLLGCVSAGGGRLTIKSKAAWICLAGLSCGVLVLAATKYCLGYCRVVSECGSVCFPIQTHRANLFADVYGDIIKDLKDHGFKFEEVVCASTNDPRLQMVSLHNVDMSRVKVLSLERGTLRGWMTYLVMDRGEGFPSIAVDWEVSSLNEMPMNGFDYWAYCQFQDRLKSRTKKKYDELDAPYFAINPDRPRETITGTVHHAWVMSSGWAGYMGVAVALTSNKYYYWFYSDAVSGDEPTYPVSGIYQYDGRTLNLDSKEHLYSCTWVVVTNGGRLCLSAPSQTGDVARLLIPDPSFNPSEPFENQRALRPEKHRQTTNEGSK